MPVDAERADEITAAPAKRGDRADRARADAARATCRQRRRQAEEHDRDREDPDDLASASSPRLPASRRRDADQRRVEDAPRVDRADAQWIAIDAGGTSQRLNVGGATIRSLDNNPAIF